MIAKVACGCGASIELNYGETSLSNRAQLERQEASKRLDQFRRDHKDCADLARLLPQKRGLDLDAALKGAVGALDAEDWNVVTADGDPVGIEVAARVALEAALNAGWLER